MSTEKKGLSYYHSITSLSDELPATVDGFVRKHRDDALAMQVYRSLEYFRVMSTEEKLANYERIIVSILDHHRKLYEEMKDALSNNMQIPNIILPQIPPKDR